MTIDGYTSELAASLGPDILERFLRYVQIDTQADENSTEFPSSAKQMDLSRVLLDELLAMGVTDARIENSYVLASLPGKAGAPKVGFLAHVDTSPDASGTGVSPRVIDDYDGGVITYEGDPTLKLSPDDSPDLLAQKGRTLVTTDGTTLLGADDKAGVAAIMSAVKHMCAHPDPERAPVRICFTPDEEVGKGISHLDLDSFGADIAYTLDGSTAGTIEDETFSAYKLVVTFHGRIAHTGSAKGKLTNALKLAARFVERLPRDETPETTSDREGFIHPMSIVGTAATATVKIMTRDFELEAIHERNARVHRLAEEVTEGWPGASVEIETIEQYLNMKDVLKDRPEITDLAREAIKAAGLSPLSGKIRGGTDGSLLTAKGLPTPNLFVGMHDIHSEKEWVAVQDIADAAATVIHLVSLWGAQSG